MSKERNNFEGLNSMTYRKWQNKMDKLNEEVEKSAEGMTSTLSRIFKNPAIKRAIQSEKDMAVRRAQNGELSPLERALIQSSKRDGEIGYAGLESDAIDYNEMVNRPWEKD